MEHVKNRSLSKELPLTRMEISFRIKRKKKNDIDLNNPELYYCHNILLVIKYYLSKYFINYLMIYDAEFDINQTL